VKTLGATAGLFSAIALRLETPSLAALAVPMDRSPTPPMASRVAAPNAMLRRVRKGFALIALSSS
jgi:hypothetical protein